MTEGIINQIFKLHNQHLNPSLMHRVPLSPNSSVGYTYCRVAAKISFFLIPLSLKSEGLAIKYYQLKEGSLLVKPEKKFRNSLFIFRRDLRLEDNTGLIFALEHSKQVIPVFIFTPEQIDHNPYRSDHCLLFMIESLIDLQNQLKKKGGRLYFFKGHPEQILNRCIRELEIDALVVNKDYTPYSTLRDQKLEKECSTYDIPFYSFDDVLLHPPEMTLKQDGKPYTVFTPYFRNAQKLDIDPPKRNSHSNYFQGSISFASKPSILSTILPSQINHSSLQGGRSKCLEILHQLSTWKHYEKVRDFPSESCTGLSPYLKFTVCSPREVYVAICKELHSHHDLIRSLYWRDFFTAISYFFPYVFKSSFRSKFDKLTWLNDSTNYKKWCEGITGFPIVDAGMRELNQTGFMHNRVRMITASFLVKDLLLNWKLGEKYFANTLIDYDPAVNNGNWQWVAGTGSDAQPYFRIFNPWRQQKKFDPDCIYIKKWVPELRSFTPAQIHSWFKVRLSLTGIDYPLPMVDHEKAAKKALNAYNRVNSRAS